jgi:type IV pilus secretin PilQ/predicted competence protein
MMATGTRSLIAVVALGVLALLLLPVPVLGQAAVSVLGIAWTPKPAPALVISASGPLTFTKTQPEPGVTVVDFPEAILAKPFPPVDEPAGGLRHAALSTVDEGGKQWARLRVEADPGANVAVTGLPSGVEVRIEKVQQARPAPRAAELNDVLAVADGTGVTVQLASQGRLETKVFTLENPARVVIDLKGAVNRVTRRMQPVGAAGVQRVRVAQFATAPVPVVRVVVDLDQPLPYHLEPTPEGALLRVGGEPVAVASAPSAPPVEVAVAAPVAPPPVAPPAKAEPVTASVKTEPAPAPVKDEPPPTKAAAVPAQIDPAAGSSKAAETQQAPVKIADEPGPALQSEVAHPAAAPAAAGSLTTPPVPAAEQPKQRPQSESPWTTTQAAMAEQAQGTTTIVAGAKELESQVARFTGEPISLELKDADIKDVLRTFAKITGLNVVVDPDVSGSVTVNLVDVPWDQALDIILRINRLGYAVENNVLRVAKMERLTQEKSQTAAFRKEAENAAPLRTITKTLSYAKAAAVKSLLTSQGFILSDRGSVVVDERTNQLIIRDAADRLEGIVNLIDSLDQPNRQVVIEARIVESTRRFARQLGVVWGFTGTADAAHGTTTGWKFPNWVTVDGRSSFGGVPNTNIQGTGIMSFAFGDILDSFNLDFQLNAAENDGLAKIVSSPKVTAQNNEKAHIQSGILLPIQTVANNTVTVQYVDATLSLDVTPQITAEGTVLLDIDIKKREPISGVNIAGGQNAPISTRDAKTRVMVRDGGTTVIGGIYQFTENDQKNGVPALYKLPLIGWMFGNRSVESTHDELLIFITPRIIKY